MSESMRVIAGDQNTIPYRPEIAVVLGDVMATILLQQIAYWYVNMGREFFKYRAPCGASKPGDSWCEELSFTGTEFDTALGKIGTKIIKKRGDNVDDVLAVQSLQMCADDELLGEYIKRLRVSGIWQNLVIYRAESNRKTFFRVNERLFSALISLAYGDYANSGILNRTNSGILNRTNSGILNQLIQESSIAYTETTSEINSAENTQSSSSPQQASLFDDQNDDDDDNLVYISKEIADLLGQSLALELIDGHGVDRVLHGCRLAMERAKDNKRGYARSVIVSGDEMAPLKSGAGELADDDPDRYRSDPYADFFER